MRRKYFQYFSLRNLCIYFFIYFGVLIYYSVLLIKVDQSRAKFQIWPLHQWDDSQGRWSKFSSRANVYSLMAFEFWRRLTKRPLSLWPFWHEFCEDEDSANGSERENHRCNFGENFEVLVKWNFLTPHTKTFDDKADWFGLSTMYLVWSELRIELL
jgi:hypothetical protein